jgi:predicted transcriptional regulator of viral defense system
MSKKTYTQRLLRLVSLKGMLRSRDLKETGIPGIYLTRLVEAGQLERVGRGLYRLSKTPISEHESLVFISKKVPQAVFCLLTALQFHELTTQLPHQVWIAVPQGSHAPKFDYPPIKLIQYSGEAYTQGIELYERNKVTLRIYGIAKTIADCFKHRNKIGLDVAIEALRDAWVHKKINIDELWHYAKICRVTNVIRPYLEVLQ